MSKQKKQIEIENIDEQLILAEETGAKYYDLEERTFQFAKKVAMFIKKTSKECFKY